MAVKGEMLKYFNKSVAPSIIIGLMLIIIGVLSKVAHESMDNPYAARLVQCASDGLPGTQAGANCWGQLGPQGCPSGLPKCDSMNEDFLGNGHNESPVFYSLGNEQMIYKSTRPASSNNNLNKHRGAVEGFGVASSARIDGDLYSRGSWSPAESFSDVAEMASQDLFGKQISVENYINY